MLLAMSLSDALLILIASAFVLPSVIYSRRRSCWERVYDERVALGLIRPGSNPCRERDEWVGFYHNIWKYISIVMIVFSLLNSLAAVIVIFSLISGMVK
jgi:hypothetical protein